MVSRLERTPFAAWWWTIDRFSLGALGAIMNAVVDALAPLGIAQIDMPATPEKVWRAIRTNQGQ